MKEVHLKVVMGSNLNKDKVEITFNLREFRVQVVAIKIISNNNNRIRINIRIRIKIKIKKKMIIFGIESILLFFL